MANGILDFLRKLGGSGNGTDRQLLAQFVSGRKEAAFATLLERHAPMVWGVCRRVLDNAADAEDAFQATFLVLACKARSISRPELLGNWLHGVATRTALKARVASRRLPRGGLDLERIQGPTTDDLLWRDLRPVLDEEIGRLPHKYRVPFVLCHVQGATNEEAARQLNCPVGTVLSRLARARERLRGRLTRRGVTLAAAALGTALEAQSAPPTLLLRCTNGAALRGVAGLDLQEAVAAPAALLTREVLRTMFLIKLRQTVSLLVGLVILAAAAAGLLARQTWAADQVPEASRQANGNAEPPANESRARWRVVHEFPGKGPVALPQTRMVALSHAGDVLVSGGLDFGEKGFFGEVRLYDTRKKELRWAREGHRGAVATVALSPDGRTVASGSADKSLVLWEASNGERKHSLNGHTDFVRTVAFAPDSRTLASGSYDGTVRLWEVRTGNLVRTIKAYELHVLGVAFSPDGTQLAAAGDDNGHSEVKLWDARTGELKKALSCDTERECFQGVAFSPDGKWLAAGSSVPGDNRKLFGKVRVWDTTTWKNVRTFDQPGGAAGPVAFAADGRTLASTSVAEPRIYLWDVKKGELGQALTIPIAPVNDKSFSRFGDVSFSQEGNILASCGSDDIVRLWRPDERLTPRD
jgi:RNA polymerase sigma factor (sigma-70 family)